MRRLVLRLRGVAKFVRTTCVQLMGRAVAKFGGGDLPRLGAGDRSPATAAIERDLPDHPSRTPLLSIIVLNLNGAQLLETMLQSFADVNTYEPFEFIVVDDGSSDKSLEVIEQWQRRLPLRCILYKDNKSFSFANNRAAEIASGELLLLLNNDVVFEVDALPKMVAAIEVATVGVVGLKHYSSKGEFHKRLPNHIGIRFAWNRQARQILAHNVAPGRQDSVLAKMPARFPAVTAASLMCRRADFLKLGGLHEEYFYGYEDVDFCLKVRLGLRKHVICLNNYYAVHDESTSRKKIQVERKALLGANRSMFQERFGYIVRRQVRTSLLDDDGSSAGRRFTIGLSGDRERCRQLAKTLKGDFAWEIARFNSRGSARGFDAILFTDPKTDIRELTDVEPHLLRIGWASDRWEQWAKAPQLHDFELMFTSSQSAADEFWKRSRVRCHDLPDDQGPDALSKCLYGVLKKTLDGYRIGIKCPAPLGDRGLQWGDYYFAYALKRAIESLGHHVRVDLWPDWYHSRTLSDDVAIVLRGRKTYKPTLAQINLLWLISHPEDVQQSELETFDHVFVASESYAEVLAKQLSVPVSPLLQCSDPDSFYPPTSPKDNVRRDILFVGNSRGEMRQVVADAISKNLPVSIFGTGWEKLLPPGWIAGAYIPNHLLHEYYAGAKIVLNDHWPDMELSLIHI